MLLVAASLPWQAATAAPCGRAAAERSGKWFAAQPPLPPRGLGRQVLHGTSAQVRAAGIDPADPRIVLATDGTRVQRSDDGGCTWREVWSLGPEDAVVEITSIDVARVAGRTRVLLTTVAEPYRPVANVVRVQVVRSDDGRGGWTTAYETVGTLNATQGYNFVKVRSGAGGAAYAVVPSPEGTVSYVRSADGRDWQARVPAAGTAMYQLWGLAVSPWNPDELWEWGDAVSGGRTLRRSTDGARTWQRVDPWPAYEPDPVWRVVDVAWPRRGGPARVVVPGGSGTSQSAEGFDANPVLAWSGDGGATFGLAFPPRGMKLSMANGPVSHTPRGDVVLVAGAGTVLRVPYGRRVPRPEEWRRLASLPVPHSLENDHFGYDAMRAGGTAACGLLVPTFTNLQLLTVAP